MIAVVLASLGFSTPSTAQDSPWESLDPTHPNFVSAGVGATTGVLGIRYSRSLGNSPVLVGLGAGLDGITPYVELTKTDGRLEDRQTYVGVGFWVGWGDQSRTGSLLFAFGQRKWLGQDWRMYIDYGVSIVPPLWGQTNLGLMVFAFPRLQVGLTF